MVCAVPRHSSLADQLKALLAYRSRPEGQIEPLQTNWTTVAANDNADPEEVVDYSFERHLRITPSVEEIVRHAGETPQTNKDGQTTRIGGLRFSDGTQTERAYTYGADGKLIQYDARMPVGAMLGCREKSEGQAGGRGYTDGELEQSNLYFARMLGTIEPRYIKRTKRRNGPSLTADESRAELARAIENTSVMPTVTYLKPGLPCGGKRIAESFVGMQKGKKGESGAIAWEDMATKMSHREAWREIMEELKGEDKRTLDTAMSAQSMKKIGETHGFTGKRAERMGKAILAASNDNFQISLKKSAA